MDVNHIEFCIAAVLAFVVGFSIQRASLCNVRAVAEILSTRRGLMLVSFFKTVLWVIGITWLIEVIAPSHLTQPDQLWALSPRTLLGGFIFGIGAAVNGGCALGTLGLLGTGELRMFTTLLGLAAGLASGVHALAKGWLSLPEPAGSAITFPPPVITGLAVLLAVCALFEILTLWRRRDRSTKWIRLPLSKRYRLSTAALVLGFANSVIYFFHGGWSYTRTAKTAIVHFIDGGTRPEALYGSLFVAVLAGVVLSSLTNGSFTLRWRVRVNWIRNFAGGVLMGVGVTLIPGGNDVLILHAIPGGSPNALPAYAALLLGTAAGLMAIRAYSGAIPRIDCSGDVCRSAPRTIR